MNSNWKLVVNERFMLIMKDKIIYWYNHLCTININNTNDRSNNTKIRIEIIKNKFVKIKQSKSYKIEVKYNSNILI